MTAALIRTFVATVFSLALAACGGGGGDTAPSPASTSIGATGGTINEPSGARVVIPAGALTTNTNIGIAQSGAGAPALPAGATAFGPIFAFTPHGTSFAVPVTITVPFDPASVPAGTTPVLYKTNASMTGWAEVTGATVNGSSMSGPVTGFSYLVVAAVPIEKRPDLTEKRWTFTAFDIDSNGPSQPIEDETQVGGEVHRQVPIGAPLIVATQSSPFPEATLEVFSNDTGGTFWTIAQAPRGTQDNPINTGTSELTQTFTFKRLKGAVSSLHFVLSGAFLETLDFGGAGPTLESCPWLDPKLRAEEITANCVDFMMQANIRMRVEAIKLLAPAPFYTLGSDARLTGAGTTWNFSLLVPPDTTGALWHENDFTLKDDGTVNTSTDGGHALVELKTPFTVTIPLDGNVGDDEIFTVTITVFSGAENRVQGESYVAAYLRDPLQAKGLEMNAAGLEQLAVQHVVPAAQVPQLCSGNPDPAAGTLQLSAANFSAPESPRNATIFVERVGGTRGEVSVLLETSDGTAVAGSDYQSVRNVVRFADGEGGKHAVTIPLILDKVAEPDETVNLRLSMFSGCAALGQRSTATLTIQDDDRPLPVRPSFAIGGTVTGLSGSGLVLRASLADEIRPTANGAFSFRNRLFDGDAYTVSVATQPSNPVQICTVTDGSGTIAGADVTNIRVDCVAPAANGALDPTFGSQGKLFGTGGSTALALQADGKVLTLGGLRLSRFNADGSIDAGFGSGGTVTIVANGGPLDAMRGLALQSDGKIVVAGNTSLPTVPLGDNFVVLRFNADGTLDSGFGSGGKVITDFNGMTDRAMAVMVQPDGKIVAAGNAVLGTLANANQDFALVRYLPDGTLDLAFGTGGKATLNITGVTDIANAAALQPDGKIVVTGRTFHDRFGRSAGEPDFGVARFRADGTVDTSFGNQGVVRIDTSLAAVTAPDFAGGDWDDANDVVIQADGRIVVGGYTITAGGSRVVLLRLTSGGELDASFGSNGLVSSSLADKANGIALQADGKIIVAGGSNSDFALVRFTAAGAPDTSFGSGGQLRIDFFGGFDNANDVLVQPDGKIVAVGSASNGTSRGTGLVRALP